MPTVIPRQYSNETMPMWLETLLHNIVLNPVSTAATTAEAGAQAALPFGKAALAALGKWRKGPQLGVQNMDPSVVDARMAQQLAARAADEASGPVQGMLDFGTDVVQGGANKVQQLVQQMKQLDLPFGDGVPVRGVPDKLGPGFTVPKQSPAGKSPFPDLAPTQQKLPMEIPSTRMGPPITSKATATPPATPAAQASAGRLGKMGGAMARHPIRTAAGVGAAGLLGYNMLNGGGGETPEEAPVATGGGGGRGVAAPSQDVDWSQLETLLNPSPQQAPQQAAPMSLTDALMPMQKQSKGFDWSQLTQMLPALLVAIAMMKRR